MAFIDSRHSSPGQNQTPSRPGTPEVRVSQNPTAISSSAAQISFEALSAKAQLAKQQSEGLDQAESVSPPALIRAQAKASSSSAEEGIRPLGSAVKGKPFDKAPRDPLSLPLGSSGAYLEKSGKTKDVTPEKQAKRDARDALFAQKEAQQTPEEEAKNVALRDAKIKASSDKARLATAVRTPLPPDEEFEPAHETVVINAKQYSKGGLRLGILDPTPAIDHLGAEGASFLSATQWTAANSKLVQNRARSHGHREILGGWEPVNGTFEQIQRKCMLKVNDILRHPRVEAFLWNDRYVGRSLRFRISESDAIGHTAAKKPVAEWKTADGKVPPLYNTGIGVAYDSKGIVHFLNKDRPEDVLQCEQAQHAAEMNRAKERGRQNAAREA